MIIEIRGVDFVNKGAELMLYAVVQQVNSMLGEATCVMSLRNGSFRQRSKIGVQHLTWVYIAKAPYAGKVLNTAAAVLPTNLRQRLQIVREDEVDILFDASGFLYSDKAWPKHMALSANRFKQLKQNGKKIILLPQAFGPFQKQYSMQVARDILSYADLVYARDRQSYGYLRELGDDLESLRLAPDFTNLVSGRKPDYGDTLVNRPCIIPNYRMIDKTETDLAQKYLPFLVACYRYLRQQELNPFFLIHETGMDYTLAEAVQSQINEPVDIIRESNPLYLKSIIGNCSFTVGSRYHGLISALSQNVPSVAVGWSHKYQSLLEDYGCPECLIDLYSPQEEMLGKIELVVNETNRADILARISHASVEQKARTQSMWDEVNQFIQSLAR